VQASYVWPADPVAALPTPQSLAHRQWVVVVLLLLLLLQGLLIFLITAVLLVRRALFSFLFLRFRSGRLWR